MRRNAITCVSELVVIFNGIKLTNSCEEKMSGLILDNDLNFGPHSRSMCKKKSRAKIRSAK